MNYTKDCHTHRGVSLVCKKLHVQHSANGIMNHEHSTESRRQEYNILKIEVPATYNRSILGSIADHKELVRDAIFHCIKSNNKIVMFDLTMNVSEILGDNGVDNEEVL